MPTNIRRLQVAAAGGTRPIPAAWAAGWRAMLESRWKARLQQVTEEALAYHEAAAAAGRDDGEPRLRELIHRVVAARRELADTEEALARLSAGSYGRCEDCASVIPAELLSVAPETRYCPRCAAGPASGPAAARQ